MVFQEPRFVEYFTLATPELEYGRMNIGSRPAKRKPSGGIETLRAIPWIFAWTQTRFHLPVWLGFGAAFKHVIDKDIRNLQMLQEMYKSAAASKEAPIPVSRVTWSPGGSFVGVAFTKHLIHLYAYTGSNELTQRIEIDAHVGGVNDLSFALPNKQLCIVTYGDDKLIKVWDANGRRLFTFEGLEAPIYSICPHHKENIQFIFSTSIDEETKENNSVTETGNILVQNTVDALIQITDMYAAPSDTTSSVGDDGLTKEWPSNGKDLYQTATVILSMIYQKMTKGGILSSSSSLPTSSNTCSSLIKYGDNALQRPVLPAWEIMEALPFVLEAILTACVHGRLSSRDLTTDWPSPATILKSVESEIKAILTHVGVAVPNCSSGDSPVMLSLPMAALVSLSITFKLDKSLEYIHAITGAALENCASSCPWPSMHVIVSL
ncbi:hypothetical protein KIW84_030356 [Lathyrus oleraceus]|uniref:Uncharacterized protein n=1 Tax=Pisum sativum TaxID=3888 RepID=A0A9D4XMU5_PEA|nr:hypothetical protein KIW84_030356 [Pisum sativum]